MNPILNPFQPSAGRQPPELSGRNSLIDSVEIDLQRILLGKSARSRILLGLRGTGKTVLLNKFSEMADKLGCHHSIIEAREDGPLTELLAPKIQQILRQLASTSEIASQLSQSALYALGAFIKSRDIKISIDGIGSLSASPTPGIADSGFLEQDLSDLFIKIGEAAEGAKKSWLLSIDEVQYLSSEDISALVVAIHRTNQKNLPIMFLGAGLPQLAALLGDAKSYAERLFQYHDIGALDQASAMSAIKEPIVKEKKEITNDALEEIFIQTGGYPYFLQEWGECAWNIAKKSPIDIMDIYEATKRTKERLDESFFRARLDRLTSVEKDYVFAMASLGEGPYGSAEVAEKMGRDPNQLGPCRANLIKKGMIYSPTYGKVAFTVPMFEDYLNRMK